MSKFVHCSFVLLAICLFLFPANSPAQQPVMPPPLPSSLANPPPPELDALPSPPELQWQPLGPKGSEEPPAPPAEVIATAPETEASIDPPPPPVIDPPANSPNPVEMELVKPEVEIWRSGSSTPQVPPRQLNRLKPAYITGTEPVWLRVQFDPLAGGKKVFVKPSGITLDLPVAMMTISDSGECLFLAQLEENVSEGHIIFYCEGVKTVLPVLRASLAKVEEKEAESGGGQ